MHSHLYKQDTHITSMNVQMHTLLYAFLTAYGYHYQIFIFVKDDIVSNCEFI